LYLLIDFFLLGCAQTPPLALSVDIPATTIHWTPDYYALGHEIAHALNHANESVKNPDK